MTYFIPPNRFEKSDGSNQLSEGIFRLGPDFAEAKIISELLGIPFNPTSLSNLFKK